MSWTLSKNICCEDCGGAVVEVTTDHSIFTKQLGLLTVPNVRKYQCVNDSAHESILFPGEANKINEFVAREVDKRISQLPIGDFVSLNEATRMLQISKQAFSKNKRISRGFIYSFSLDGRRCYYRKSVEAFRDYNDGRISLQVANEPNVDRQLVEQLASVLEVVKLPAWLAEPGRKSSAMSTRTYRRFHGKNILKTGTYNEIHTASDKGVIVWGKSEPDNSTSVH